MAGWGLGYLGFAPKSWNEKAKGFFEGTPEKHEQVSTLLPEQQSGFNQLQAAAAGRGAGGAFGTSADYYRDILSNDPSKMQEFYAPHLRQYNEDIVPGLSEQFAGMGAGGLSSSGFRNAQIQGATDLSERLGSIRANLRQQAAQGLTGIGQTGLGTFSQDRVTQQGSGGLLSNLGPLIGAGAGAYFGGPLGALAGYQLGSSGKAQTNSSPYGGSSGSGWNLGPSSSGWNV